ncbi:MAG: hypothetical protein WA743_09850 [Pseudolabrys sp.]
MMKTAIAAGLLLAAAGHAALAPIRPSAPTIPPPPSGRRTSRM